MAAASRRAGWRGWPARRRRRWRRRAGAGLFRRFLDHWPPTISNTRPPATKRSETRTGCRRRRPAAAPARASAVACYSRRGADRLAAQARARDRAAEAWRSCAGSRARTPGQRKLRSRPAPGLRSVAPTASVGARYRPGSSLGCAARPAIAHLGWPPAATASAGCRHLRIGQALSAGSVSFEAAFEKRFGFGRRRKPPAQLQAVVDQRGAVAELALDARASHSASGPACSVTVK